MQVSTLVSTCLLGALSAAATAQNTLTLRYEGTVTPMEAQSVFPSAQIGDPIAVFITLDPAAPDISTGFPSRYESVGAPYGIVAVVGDEEAQMIDLRIDIRNDHPSDYFVGSAPRTGFNGQLGFEVRDFDDTGTALTGTALPNSEADLATLSLEFRLFRRTFSPQSGPGKQILLTADNLQLAHVDVGAQYCPQTTPNSTGQLGLLSATGSPNVGNNLVVLEANQLPAGSFSLFIVSRQQGFVANPGGSDGNVCLGGSLGRYVGAGQVQLVNSMGGVSLPLDLAFVPQPLGFEAVVAGESWNFQAWHRDSGPGGPNSNFTNGLEIAFE